MNKTLYWVTFDKFPNGHPHEESIFRILAARGYLLKPLVWTRDPIPKLGEGEAIIIRTPWDYFYRISDFEAWIDRLPERGVQNPKAILKWNSDKAYLRELEEGGIRLVPTQWVSESNEESLRRRLLSVFPGREKVIKPLKSASAHDTHRFNDESLPSLSVFLNRAVMVQPFVPEVVTDGECSQIFLGGKFSHAVLKKPKSGDFRVQESFGGQLKPFEPNSVEREFGERVIASVQEKFTRALEGRPLLYGRVDYVKIGGVPHLMELELLEPDLYLHHAPGGAERFEAAIRVL